MFFGAAINPLVAGAFEQAVGLHRSLVVMAAVALVAACRSFFTVADLLAFGGCPHEEFLIEAVRIVTAPSSATAPSDCRGQVLVSGSYGGEYNAYHAGKWGIRGVVLNDAGVANAVPAFAASIISIGSILPQLRRTPTPATSGDGDHMLEFGRVSFVNRAAARWGCRAGDSVRGCAERMCHAPVATAAMPLISGGKRYSIAHQPGEPAIVCLDAAPMLEPADKGRIVITGSHAALFRGKPDDVIRPQVRAIFFSDAGVGMDAAGIARLPCSMPEESPPGPRPPTVPRSATRVPSMRTACCRTSMRRRARSAPGAEFAYVSLSPRWSSTGG